MKKLASLLLVLFAVLFLVGCSCNSDEKPKQEWEGSRTIIVGEEVNIIDVTFTELEVTWEIEGDAIELIDNEKVKGVKPGKSTIKTETEDTIYKIEFIVNADTRTDQDKVNEDVNSMNSLPEASLGGFYLDLQAVGKYNGSTITWSSSNEAVINPINGYVTAQDEETTVKLTATFRLNEATKSIVFTVLVYAKTDVDKVVEDSNNLPQFPESVSDGFRFALPDTGANGSVITWSSSDEAAINSITGVVTSQETETTVYLTATLELNEASTLRKYTILVCAKSAGGE